MAGKHSLKQSCHEAAMSTCTAFLQHDLELDCSITSVLEGDTWVGLEGGNDLPGI